MKYKNYHGSIEYDEESETLHGKVLHVRDLITYEAGTAKGLKKAFQDSVDDYLKTCETEGIEPNKPYSGSFNVRPGAELHEQLARIAAMRGRSINALVKDALSDFVSKAGEV
ncbi:MAG: type II toxin-antitoxin system HicB family antitoxin [Nitrospinae bacterium]|nr:type II toxin-antitoxin system HicB family antitoxin [Nitrospinota bacterium]